MFSNAYHSSSAGQKAMVMAKKTRKLVITECPTYSEWFKCFVKGAHKCMGDIVKPDWALAMDVLLLMMDMLEDDWYESNEATRLDIALGGAFYLIAFCCALYGEEVPMTNLTGMVKHWNAGGFSASPHVVVALLG